MNRPSADTAPRHERKSMTRTTTLQCTLPAILLASLAQAQVSTILDKVPANSAFIVAIQSVSGLHDDIASVAEAFSIPMDDMDLGPVNVLMEAPGLNAQAPAAISVVLPDDFDPQMGSEPDFFMVFPVSDYKQLVESLGGTADGVSEVEVDIGESYMKNIGGGFAVMGNRRESLEAFEAGGAGREFERMLGQAGRSIASRSDVMLIANIKAAAPLIQMALDEMAMNMAFAPPPADQMAQAFQSAGQALIDSGQAAYVAATYDDTGLALSMGAQFDPESPAGQLLHGQGRTGELFSKLPDWPFLFAVAMDTSAEPVQKVLAGMTEMMKQLTEELGDAAMPQNLDWARMMALSKGSAVLIGSPPALMGGGVLSDTIAYMASDDSVALRDLYKESMVAMNGTENNGIAIESSYEVAAREIAGQSVDVYSMKMTSSDVNIGPQLDMMTMAMYGPSGANGFVATGNSGLLMTMTRNSRLMEAAINAAKGQSAAFNASDSTRAVSDRLPPGRILEGYIGLKGIADNALPMLAMQFGGAIDLEVPENLSPIGFAAATADGGMSFGIVIPNDSMAFIARLSGMFMQMNAPAPEGGNSRF